MHAPSKKICVFLVDDHLIFRQGLAKLLNQEQDLAVVEEAGHVAEAIPRITEKQPDILILELRLPGADGLELLPQMIQLSPATRSIVFTNSQSERDVVESMRLGARGYALKQHPTSVVLSIIRRVAAGEIWLETRHLEMVLRALDREYKRMAQPQQLSQREKQIVQMVLNGCRNKEIATELRISQKTVKTHLSNIFDKLGVSDRLEMALTVLDKKLLG